MIYDETYHKTNGFSGHGPDHSSSFNVPKSDAVIDAADCAPTPHAPSIPLWENKPLRDPLPLLFLGDSLIILEGER